MHYYDNLISIKQLRFAFSTLVDNGRFLVVAFDSGSFFSRQIQGPWGLSEEAGIAMELIDGVHVDVSLLFWLVYMYNYLAL